MTCSNCQGWGCESCRTPAELRRIDELMEPWGVIAEAVTRDRDWKGDTFRNQADGFHGDGAIQ